jgi:hypothetical protein
MAPFKIGSFNLIPSFTVMTLAYVHGRVRSAQCWPPYALASFAILSFAAFPRGLQGS